MSALDKSLQATPRRSEIMKHAEFFFQDLKCTMHVVLHINGDPVHFDVVADFQRIAETLGHKAMENRSRVSVVADGHVSVRYFP